MRFQKKEANSTKDKNKISIIEKIGHKIPDPVIIFIGLYILVMLTILLTSNITFETVGQNGDTVVNHIRNMFTAENIRWIFDNALLTNWLGYAGGILGTILIVMFGIGIAEESGLLSALIRRMGGNISDRFLPYVLVFSGILSNIATDAGYVILIPLAGLLYLGLKKNPLIGMFAAFAGVSAGFSANLVPATVVDIIIGKNAQGFAESQGVPFVSYLGNTINPFMMHYIFMIASTVLLVLLGGFITNKWIRPKFENIPYSTPDDIAITDFGISPIERKGLRFAGLGFITAIIIDLDLAFGPLR